VVVVGGGILENRIAPLGGGVVESGAHPMSAARLGELQDHVAFAAFPRRLREAEGGVLRRPVGEAVMVFRRQHHVPRSGLLRGGDPLVAVELRGVERFGEHRLAIPISVPFMEAPNAEVQEDSEFPVLVFELTRGRQGGRRHQFVLQ